MKSTKLLFLLFMFSMIFQSCSSDDEDKVPTFNADFIKQISWNGTLLKVEDGKTVWDYGVNILFSTDNRGKYKYTSGFYNPDDDFQYRLDGKLIVIWGNSDRDITGDWILVKIKTDQMILQKGFIGDKSDYYILTLTKQNIKNKPDRRH